jgi:hypothetical protein
MYRHSKKNWNGNELKTYRKEFDPTLLPPGGNKKFVYRNIYFVFEGIFLKRVRVIPRGSGEGKVFLIQFTNTFNAIRIYLAKVIHQSEDITVSMQDINPKEMCNILHIEDAYRLHLTDFGAGMRRPFGRKSGF